MADDLPVPDYARIFEETPSPLLLLTPDLLIVGANRARREVTGTTLEDTVGRHLFDVFPTNPDDPASDGMANVRASLETARETRRPHTMAIQKYDIPVPGGGYEERYWSPRNVPILDERGEVVLLLHRSDDITAYVRGRDAADAQADRDEQWRARAERVEADLFARTRELEGLNAALARGGKRAELLARVTGALAGTLDAEEAVGLLGRMVVPTLADWCVVTLADGGDRPGARDLRDIGSWHDDPDLRPVVEQYARARMEGLSERSPLAQALRTGRPVLLAEGATEVIRGVLAPGPAAESLALLAPDSFIVLPLRARGRTLGLLTLFNGADRSPISPEEVATATDIAARAGLALDNARLYHEQRALAEGLQRSLLTEPAQPGRTQIVVRYIPAAEAAQVGGDWYDAFVQPDGSTVVVIGDVIGHDTQAAAAMSQVRTIVRTTAVVTGEGPAEVLREVDEALETLQVGTSATAVVARLEQTDAERQRGTTRLRWSNAGHPPPLVLHPDGLVMGLTAISSDLLLGVMPSSRRRESEVVLAEGSTVLLYTDGLVERRDQPLQVGLERLQEALEDLAARDLDLDGLVDAVLARLLPARREDDVAVLALRLHPPRAEPSQPQDPR